ncbi:hypothetical protein ACI77O_13650 [Pseudomonas tritici]|uniref:hypothetical protein n=1 Tax=Pseudomonas tritici TaxID=2745518 RepID=UPI00387AB60B
MVTVLSNDDNIAPLAFSLSIHSEKVLPALHSNALNTFHMALHPYLLATVSGMAAGLAFWAFSLPSLLAVPAGAVAGYLSLKPFQRYYQNAYVSGRVDSIRAVLAGVIDSEDARHLADLAAGILTSQYGNQKWTASVNSMRPAGQGDAYQFLAKAFAYSPDLWSRCARNAYARALSGVVPGPAHAEAV